MNYLECIYLRLHCDLVNGGRNYAEEESKEWDKEEDEINWEEENVKRRRTELGRRSGRNRGGKREEEEKEAHKMFHPVAWSQSNDASINRAWDTFKDKRLEVERKSFDEIKNK